MFKTRVLTAVALLVVFLAALYWAPPAVWSVLMLVAMLAGAWEWARLSGFPQPYAWVYLALTAVLTAWSALEGAGPAWFVLSAAFWILVVPMWLGRRWKASRRWVGALVGWVVLVPTALALMSLRESGGATVLLILLATVWIADSFAYFAGKRFGRHKLAPAISPGKTWEGVAGALLAVALYAVIVSGLMPGEDLALPLDRVAFAVPLLLVLCALGVVGDLFESLMKRQAGLKDSGTWLPGHGGVLDRIDGLTSTLPLAALAAAISQSPLL